MCSVIMYVMCKYCFIFRCFRVYSTLGARLPVLAVVSGNDKPGSKYKSESSLYMPTGGI